MWVHLTNEEIQAIRDCMNGKIADDRKAAILFWTKDPGVIAIKEKLLASASLLEKAEKKIGEQIDRFDAEDPYRKYALDNLGDDDLEFDEDATVSAGDDPGAWVHSWTWVTDEQAGTAFCCESCSGVWSIDMRDPDSGNCKECQSFENAKSEKCED